MFVCGSGEFYLLYQNNNLCLVVIFFLVRNVFCLRILWRLFTVMGIVVRNIFGVFFSAPLGIFVIVNLERFNDSIIRYLIFSHVTKAYHSSFFVKRKHLISVYSSRMRLRRVQLFRIIIQL